MGIQKVEMHEQPEEQKPEPVKKMTGQMKIQMAKTGDAQAPVETKEAEVQKVEGEAKDSAKSAPE